jgi:hypothetical protein
VEPEGLVLAIAMMMIHSLLYRDFNRRHRIGATIKWLPRKLPKNDANTAKLSEDASIGTAPSAAFAVVARNELSQISSRLLAAAA